MTQEELDGLVICIATKGVYYAETTCDFRRQSDPDSLRRETEYIMLRNIIYSLQDYDLSSEILSQNDISYLLELAILILEKCPNFACSRHQDTWITTVPAPKALPATAVDYEGFDANWEGVENATGYFLDVSADPDFHSFLPGFENLDVGLNLTWPIPDLDENTAYYYRLRASFISDLSGNSNEIVTITEEIFLGCATYEPYFENPPIDHQMFLSCGQMKLTTGAIGDYVIEWHLGSNTGTVVFTSGETSDPGEVQAHHPFTNEVVFAGTLYPVIKYVYINGIKYVANWDGVNRYSPSFASCLDFTNNTPGTVIVDAIECTTVLGNDTLYPFYLSYSPVIDLAADKSRLLKYNICGPDMKYLAVEAYFYEVSDQIKIYYCTLANPTGVLIDNYIHGTRDSVGGQLVTNLYPNDYPNNPRIAYIQTGLSPLCFIVNISSFIFVVGDYLRIEITGSVYEPLVSNTKWYLKLKSLTAISNAFITDENIHKIVDTPAIAYLSDPSCRYEISYNTADVLSGTPTRYTVGVPDAFKYLNFWTSLFGNTAGWTWGNPIRLGMDWKAVGSNYGQFGNTGWSLFSDLDAGERISVDKVGDDLTFTFTDIDDYNKLKSDIAAWKAHSSYTAWLGYTDTDCRYYATLYLHFKFADSIGDIVTGDYYFYIFWGSTITYNDVAKTVKWTLIAPTNNFPDPGDCNNVDVIVSNAISTINSTKNLANFSNHSHIKPNGWLYGTWPYFYTSHVQTAEYLMSWVIEDCFVNGILDMEALGFMKGLVNGWGVNVWYLPHYYDRATLTDVSDHAHRLANWKLERRTYLRTDDPADTAYEIVYETP